MNREHLAFVLFLLLAPCLANAEDARQLEGLWSSYKRFGPDIYGPLLIDKGLERAEVGSFKVDVLKQSDLVQFE